MFQICVRWIWMENTGTFVPKRLQRTDTGRINCHSEHTTTALTVLIIHEYSWLCFVIYCLLLTCWTGTCHRRFAWPLTATRRASQLPARFKGAVMDVMSVMYPVFIPAGPSIAIDVRTSSTSWRASISMAGLSVGQSYRLGKIWNCVAISAITTAGKIMCRRETTHM